MSESPATEHILELKARLVEAEALNEPLRDAADLLDFYFNHHMNCGGQRRWIIDSPLGMQWRLCEWNGSEFAHVETDAERKDFPSHQDAIREARRRAIAHDVWQSLENDDE